MVAFPRGAAPFEASFVNAGETQGLRIIQRTPAIAKIDRKTLDRADPLLALVIITESVHPRRAYFHFFIPLLRHEGLNQDGGYCEYLAEFLHTRDPTAATPSV